VHALAPSPLTAVGGGGPDVAREIVVTDPGDPVGGFRVRGRSETETEPGVADAALVRFTLYTINWEEGPLVAPTRTRTQFRLAESGDMLGRGMDTSEDALDRHDRLMEHAERVFFEGLEAEWPIDEFPIERAIFDDVRRQFLASDTLSVTISRHEPIGWVVNAVIFLCYALGIFWAVRAVRAFRARRGRASTHEATAARDAVTDAQRSDA
jgi:hypothetical protein